MPSIRNKENEFYGPPMTHAAQLPPAARSSVPRRKSVSFAVANDTRVFQENEPPGRVSTTPAIHSDTTSALHPDTASALDNDNEVISRASVHFVDDDMELTSSNFPSLDIQPDALQELVGEVDLEDKSMELTESIDHQPYLPSDTRKSVDLIDQDMELTYTVPAYNAVRASTEQTAPPSSSRLSNRLSSTQIPLPMSRSRITHNFQAEMREASMNNDEIEHKRDEYDIALAIACIKRDVDVQQDCVIDGPPQIYDDSVDQKVPIVGDIRLCDLRECYHELGLPSLDESYIASRVRRRDSSFHLASEDDLGSYVCKDTERLFMAMWAAPELEFAREASYYIIDASEKLKQLADEQQNQLISRVNKLHNDNRGIKLSVFNPIVESLQKSQQGVKPGASTCAIAVAVFSESSLQAKMIWLSWKSRSLADSLQRSSKVLDMIEADADVISEMRRRVTIHQHNVQQARVKTAHALRTQISRRRHEMEKLANVLHSDQQEVQSTCSLLKQLTHQHSQSETQIQTLLDSKKRAQADITTLSVVSSNIMQMQALTRSKVMECTSSQEVGKTTLKIVVQSGEYGLMHFSINDGDVSYKFTSNTRENGSALRKAIKVGYSSLVPSILVENLVNCTIDNSTQAIKSKQTAGVSPDSLWKTMKLAYVHVQQCLAKIWLAERDLSQCVKIPRSQIRCQAVWDESTTDQLRLSLTTETRSNEQLVLHFAFIIQAPLLTNYRLTIQHWVWLRSLECSTFDCKVDQVQAKFNEDVKSISLMQYAPIYTTCLKLMTDLGGGF